MAGKGRPIKGGRMSKKRAKLRKQWREASKRYYQKNKGKILAKRRK
jgi:hypothetical protein